MGEGFFYFSRASFAFDFLVCALLVVLVLLTLSIYLVRVKRSYKAHRVLQISLSALLLAVIILFEIEVRFAGWSDQALVSPHYNTILFPFLWLHVLCAVVTCGLWAVTLWGALKSYDVNPTPNPYSANHKMLGKYSTIGLWVTAVTGLNFYYLAFVCS